MFVFVGNPERLGNGMPSLNFNLSNQSSCFFINKNVSKVTIAKIKAASAQKEIQTTWNTVSYRRFTIGFVFPGFFRFRSFFGGLSSRRIRCRRPSTRVAVSQVENAFYWISGATMIGAARSSTRSELCGTLSVIQPSVPRRP